MSDPSGSGLERGAMCPASYALPHAARTGIDATVGTSNHDKIEDALAAGDLTDVPDVVRASVEGAKSLDVEVAYAINVQTEMVRILGRRLKRGYGKLEPGEIPLTLDLVKELDHQVFQVFDWKSRKRVTPAKYNLQIKAAAVAVMKTKGQRGCLGHIAYLDNGEVDKWYFDEFDMAAFFEDMRTMLSRIDKAREVVKEGKSPDVHAGSWCDYCPAMAYCPAHNRLAMQMMGELEFIKREVAFFTPEQVSKAWDLKKKIEGMIATVDESLRLRIQQSVIPRPNNKRLAMVECERTGFDATKAKKRLQELGQDLTQFNRTTQYTQVKEVAWKGTEATDNAQD